MAEDKKLNPEELEAVAGGECFETMEEAVFHAKGVGICPYCGKDFDKKCPKCGVRRTLREFGWPHSMQKMRKCLFI